MSSSGETAPLTDLAGRVLGGVVVACNDQFYAEASNLLLPYPARFDPDAYDAKGKVYDGWETRRRRTVGDDWVVVRLAAPGVVERIDVDTAWFKGNFPAAATVHGAWLEGFPGPNDVWQLSEQVWRPLAPRTPLTGHAVTSLPVTPEGAPELAGKRVSHVRLTIHPDGGVARLRVWGRAVPDPALLTGTLDLAAAENGGRVLGSSDEFYGSADHLITPGRAATMADGWENARRRDGGNDWVDFELAGAGRLRRVEVDTTCFVGNAPGRVVLRGIDARVGGSASAARLADPASWPVLLDLQPQPDTRHVLALGAVGAPGATERPVTHVRLEAHPDGGMSRLRLWGELDDDALAAAERRWAETAL
ncbi:allantoicase [Quadrisphaera granulorum]|uniref:Probable allantoicase n=1 Tax=Quadrisphaera granulorum TaxID=317664 RepID=A0A316A6S1_9ACTN|nr:allantoicase [Quadrisphaera granulorum]PWJ52928.1 allantoicase [Quadrisphaera granulorum]SZE97310.1 allantoicase [Quadrisphaera granulorum]